MAGKAKKQKEEVPNSPEDAFELQLQSVGLAGTLKLADSENAYEVESTGWPGVDKLIGGDKEDQQGLPKQIHVEVFSEVEHVGKTTFALQMGVNWQKKGYRVGVLDIEPSITPAYLREVGFITSKEQARELGLHAVRLLQPQVSIDENTTDMFYAETILDTIGIAANLFDLLIVDSVDALVSEADSLKQADEGSQMGGVSKYIKNFLRKNTKRRATIIWINHMSQGLGQYAKSYTTGGKAIPRYSTIRFKLERVELLRENDKADPYGFVTKVSTVKNRVSGPFRFTLLNYVFGEAFSVEYDYFKEALKRKLITKAGAWFYVLGDKDDNMGVAQGELNLYKLLRAGEDKWAGVFDYIKSQIDGVEIEVEELSEGELAQAKLLAKEIEVEDK